MELLGAIALALALAGAEARAAAAGWPQDALDLQYELAATAPFRLDLDRSTQFVQLDRREAICLLLRQVTCSWRPRCDGAAAWQRVDAPAGKDLRGVPRAQRETRYLAGVASIWGSHRQWTSRVVQLPFPSRLGFLSWLAGADSALPGPRAIWDVHGGGGFARHPGEASRQERMFLHLRGSLTISNRRPGDPPGGPR